MAKQAQLDAVRPVLNALDAEVTAAEKVLDAVEASSGKAAKATEAGLEKVADVVPEALDKSVTVTAEVARRGVRALRNPKVVVAVGAAVMVAGSVGVGYFTYKLLKKKLEKEFEERLDTELDSMRDFYIRRYKTDDFATPQAAAEALGAQTLEEAAAAEEAHEALDQYQGRTGTVAEAPERAQAVAYDQVTVKTDTVLKGIQVSENGDVKQKDITVERNVFVEGRPLVIEEWDAEAEEARRNEETPYVISHEEFMENKFEHPQHTLTYYEGDDILAESNDSVVNEVEMIVGNDNLTRFGHGSRDPNIVYIRNERMEADYEVVRSQGKYSEEVMGLRHSADNSRRRTRWAEDA